MWQYHPLLIIFAAGGLISVGIVLFLWRRWHQYGSSYLVGALGMMGINNAVYSFAAMLKTASTSLDASLLFYKFEFIAGLNPALMLVVALVYVGKEHWLTRKTLGLLGGVSVGLILLIVVNPADVMITTPELIPAQGVLAFEHEFPPLFSLPLAWMFGITLLSIAIVFEGAVTGLTPTEPGIAIAVAFVLPSAALALKIAGLYPPGGKGINVTPAAAALTVSILAFVLLRYRILDTIPVGRNRAIEVMNDGYLLVTEPGQVLDANPAARELLTGLDDAPLENRNVRELVPNYEEFDTRDTMQFSSHDRTVEMRSSDVHGAAQTAGQVFLLQDVTAREQRKQELERYERVVENVPVGVYRMTPTTDGRLLFGNQALADILGASSVEELSEYTARDFYVDPEEQDELVSQLRSDGAITNEDVRMETVDGEEFWASLSNARAIDGERTYFEGMVQDITERKEFEQELKRARERYRDERNGKEAIRQLLLQTSTDQEIADSVCRLLVDSYGYEAAQVVRENQSEPVDAVTIAQYGEDCGFGIQNEGEIDDATRQALETGTTVTAVAEHPDGVLGEQLAAAGLHSVRSIPLEHEGVSFGVLTVLRTEPGTEFSQELADEVAAAIAFKQRVHQQREALTAETVVELTVQFTDDHFLADLSNDGSVPADATLGAHELTEDDGLVTYIVQSSNVAADSLQSAVAPIETVEASTIVTEREGKSVLRVRVAPPTVGRVLAKYGGAVQSLTASNGHVDLTAQFPRGAQMNAAIDVIRDHWPAAMIRTHNERSVDSDRPRLFDQLTAKQEEALLAATLSGFFDRPQGANATDVADTLGVSHSTFLHHIRKAEEKIFREAFGSQKLHREGERAIRSS
jgi:PAS domain S-box-containing protein